MATVKLLTNIAVDGDLLNVWYAKSKKADETGRAYADQVKLRARWTGKFVNAEMAGSEADLYLPVPVAYEMEEQGILERTADDRDGHPAWAVLIPAVTVQKEQAEGGKVFTRVLARGPALPSRPAPSAAPVPVTVKRMAGGPGMPSAAPTSVGTAPHAPSVANHWDELASRYQRCYAIAVRTLDSYRGEESDIGFTGQDYTAAAATLFIEANRRNLEG